MITNPRRQLTECYRAAVDGARPDQATRAAVAALPLAAGRPVWIVALGKAAHAMAVGAVAALADAGREPAGGVVAAPEAGASPHATLQLVVGDHPIPGARSAQAAAAIGDVVARVRPDNEVLVLVSGGGTSLIAAPLPELTDFGQRELGDLYAALLASGADIVAMNAVRKRFARWSGGRLAAALAPARVHCLMVSDVPGDDPAAISSGPCVPDPTTGAELVAELERSGLWAKLPPRARAHLSAVSRGDAPDTTTPSGTGAPVTATVIVSNAHAVSAAAAWAREAGIDEVTVVPTPLAGEAAIVGVRIASDLIARKKRARGPWKTRCVVWGGETTVTLDAGAAAPDGETALGGRNQELALAAARSFGEAGDQAHGITLLAAGTDGRDGPTDAAGAIVDGLTWCAIDGAGRNPARDLATHNAYRALDAAHALLRTGHSGTNVMDIVIALVL